MAGHCARCGQPTGGDPVCDHCGSQPVGEVTAFTLPMPSPTVGDVPDGPSFLRRLTVGAITLLALYHGLKHLAIAGALAQSGSDELPQAALFGLLIAATLAAAVAAGTVNRRAVLSGLLLAVGAAVAFAGPDLAAGATLPEAWFVGAPTLLLLVGSIGGFAGRLIVPPAPRLPQFGAIDFTRAAPEKRKAVRIIWWRVGFGVAVVLLGTIYADLIREGLTKALAGRNGSFAATRLLTWQVSIVAAILGGVAAGMNTRSGARQGVTAGLLAAVFGVFAIASRGAAESLIVEFWLDQLNLPEVGPLLFAVLGGTMGMATAVGGWLGSQICPPPARR